MVSCATCHSSPRTVPHTHLLGLQAKSYTLAADTHTAHQPPANRRELQHRYTIYGIVCVVGISILIAAVLLQAYLVTRVCCTNRANRLYQRFAKADLKVPLKTITPVPGKQQPPQHNMASATQLQRHANNTSHLGTLHPGEPLYESRQAHGGCATAIIVGIVILNLLVKVGGGDLAPPTSQPPAPANASSHAATHTPRSRLSLLAMWHCAQSRPRLHNRGCAREHPPPVRSP